MGLDFKRQSEIWMHAQKTTLALAAARVQIGIRFSSVKRLNKSSAEAISVASTSTVDVFTVAALGGGLFAAGFGTGAVVVMLGMAEVALVDCTGVPLRLGSVLTVRSFPCASMIAVGNSTNLASSATGNLCLAS